MLKKIDLIPIFIKKKKIFDDKMEIIIPINFNEKNSDLILAKKRWIFNENLRSEFYLKKKN